MKKVLFVLAGVIALVAVLGAVLVVIAPKDFAVEREIVINRPKDEVFAYLVNLKNQNEWGPWAKKDPAMKQEYRGTDGTVGFVSAWEGNDEVGSGEQEIKEIVDGERIKYELRFKMPFESKSNAHILTEAVGEAQTKVKWGFSGSMPIPMNVFLLMMDIDKQAGKDFEEGLATLKTILEK